MIARARMRLGMASLKRSTSGIMLRTLLEASPMFSDVTSREFY